MQKKIPPKSQHLPLDGFLSTPSFFCRSVVGWCPSSPNMEIWHLPRFPTKKPFFFFFFSAKKGACACVHTLPWGSRRERKNALEYLLCRHKNRESGFVRRAMPFCSFLILPSSFFAKKMEGERAVACPFSPPKIKTTTSRSFL